MQYRADLHCHSRASDGLLTPADLVMAAADRGVFAIALTDHDTTDGFAEARDAGEKLGIEVIAGVEISCLEGTREVHVLGLFIDPSNEDLENLLSRSRKERESAVAKVLERLSAVGAPVEVDEVMKYADGATLARPHFARALVEKGHAGSVSQAFDLYLGDGRPARVHRFRPTVAEACRAIRLAGGISSLAHPGAKPGLISQESVYKMVNAGLDAIEVHHPSHDLRTRERLESWASSMGLHSTGGSDFHGNGDGVDIGFCFLDDAHLERLRALAARARED